MNRMLLPLLTLTLSLAPVLCWAAGPKSIVVALFTEGKEVVIEPRAAELKAQKFLRVFVEKTASELQWTDKERKQMVGE